MDEEALWPKHALDRAARGSYSYEYGKRFENGVQVAKTKNFAPGVHLCSNNGLPMSVIMGTSAP